MPNFWNTVGDLKFYNFISNKYFNGAPPASYLSFTDSFLIRDWLANYVFTSNPSLFSSSYIYLYFPSVIGSPTENESCTGNPNSTNNYRFRLYLNQDLSTYYNNGITNAVNTQNSGSTATVFTISNTTKSSNTSALSFDYVFTFGVASPTTICLFEFLLPNQPEKSLTNYTLTNFWLFGWAHDSYYPSPFVNASLRYNACFYMEGRSNWGSGVVTLNGNRPTLTGSTTSQEINLPRYYDIECTTGSYTPGLFFTDLILRDKNNTDGYPMIGKVDNRVACIGRGNFTIGEIYRATNIFGRTGTEDWMCVSNFMPSALTINTWTPTPTFRNDYYKAWKLGEYDYLMVRIYTEED